MQKSRRHADERKEWEARAKLDKDDIIAILKAAKEVVTPAPIDVPKDKCQ